MKNVQSAEVLSSKLLNPEPRASNLEPRTLNLEPRTSNIELRTLNLERLKGKEIITVSPTYFRPTEVDLLIGNPKKAKEKLGWEAKTRLKELVKIMVFSDLQKVFEKGS